MACQARLRNWSPTTSRFCFEQKATKRLQITPFVTFVFFCSIPTAQTGKLFWTMSLSLRRISCPNSSMIQDFDSGPLSRVPCDSTQIRRKLPNVCLSAGFVWSLRKKGRTSRFRGMSLETAASHEALLAGWSVGFSLAHLTNGSSPRGGTPHSNESPCCPMET